MPSSLIIGALGLEAGGFAAALVTLGVRLAETYAISALMNKNVDTPTQQGSQGGQIQLPPATSNKLPVVYGIQFVSPIIVDAMLSTDQQTMWYVLAFSEATDSGELVFGDIYWDDKLLVFPPNNPHSISCWYVPASAGGAEANSRVTGVAGKIGMWFYKNGSYQETTHRCLDTFGDGSITQQKSNIDAVSVLNDAGIPPEIRWTANNLMSNTVFAICGVSYDQNHGVTNLGQIKAEIINTLGTGNDINGAEATDMGPGAVIKDYMRNSRYGCGIPESNINLASLTALDTFSNQEHALKLVDGTYKTGAKYTINGILDTALDCMTNLNNIANCCDSWIQWDERNALWGVVINRSYNEAGFANLTNLFSVNKNNIIGGININPTDLKTAANHLTIQYPNFVLQNQTDYRYYDLPSNLRNANEPENTLTVSFPFVDNDQQATWLGYKKLWSSREDLVINFTMDYSGIVVDAGDVVRITHDWYGWTDKLFRVTQVKESKDTAGFLSVQISAMSYNEQIYIETDPGFFYLTEFNNSFNTDPTIITPPGKPTITVDTATNLMVVSSTVPTLGNVKQMEFWYGNSPEINTNNYALYETQNYVIINNNLLVNTDLYPNGYTEKINALNLPTGDYYWATRAVGPATASEFSPISDKISWTYNSLAPGATGAGTIQGLTLADHSIDGSKIITGDPATVGTAASPGFFDTMGPIAVAGLGLAAISYGYKEGVFDGLLPEGWKKGGGGNDSGDTPIDPTTTILYADSGDYATSPAVGDNITILADATPPQESPSYTYASTGFSDYGSGGSGGDSYFDWA